MKWDFDGQPTEPGWYAVLVCWDSQEGIFPMAAHWDGQAWKHRAIVAFGEKCESEADAKALADLHDPDDPH